MKTKIITLILASSLSSLSYANNFKPSECPTVAALSKIGVNEADLIANTWIGVNLNNKFETPDFWSLITMGIDDAKSNDEAVEKYNKALTHMKLIEGPVEQSGNNNEWACLYQDSDGKDLYAMTINPPPSTD